jgi:hypothetical protein
MADLTLAEFSGAVGRPYEVEVQGHTFPLELVAAEEIAHSPREGGGFRLEFRGPVQPILPQAIYPFRSEGGGDAAEIFIVPIAQDAAGTRYEAVFF